MPCPIIAFSGPESLSELTLRLDKRRRPDPAVEDQVRAVIDAVAERGDAALVDFTRRFDCPEFTEAMLPVPVDRLEEALDRVPPEDMEIIAEAMERIETFHERQKANSWWQTEPDGTILGQLVRPMDRVGLYVPGGAGGDTPLVSSLIMNAVPALVAGVPEIAVVSPPRADGSLNPYILATAMLLGITEIYAVGSSWAVAALALGTETIEPVDLIAGPGNIHVTTAKRLLIGRVGIDMIAGPSEIVILADDSAPADWLAADLLSQAEHDPLAACILITNSARQAEATRTALGRRLADLPRSALAQRALADWGGIVVVPDLDVGLEIVNLLAPEHLELAVREPWPMLGSIRHAGAIFLGAHSPEPLGDYFAGPNHVLPTMGTARFSSALSVETFTKKSSLIAATPTRLREDAAKIARLARLEGLEAHARSAECRLEKPSEES